MKVGSILSLSVLVCACQGAERPPPPRPKAPSGATFTATREPDPGAMAMHASPTGPNAGARVVSAIELESPAPYDLAADLQRRKDAAQRELGRGTQLAVVSDVYVVIGAPGYAGFSSAVALVRDAMAAYMNRRFSRKPEAAISVYLFGTPEPYEAFCRAHYGDKCLSIYGFYRHAEREMVMNAGPGLGTLTHELVHPLVEVDFPSAPTWINEGIASVFEAPYLAGKEIHGQKNWRLPRLLKAMNAASERDEARLDKLFGTSDDAFRNELEDLHYATARYVCQWLDDRGKLWPFYQRWRDNADADPTGEKAFEEVVGMSPARAHADWAKWVRGL